MGLWTTELFPGAATWWGQRKYGRTYHTLTAGNDDKAQETEKQVEFVITGT